MPDLPEELRLLLEERAVLRTLHQYCHANDSGDVEAWVDTFTPDGVFEVVAMPGEKPIHCERGSDEIRAYGNAYPKPPPYQKHIMIDPIIEFDGDEATAESYWMLLSSGPDGPPLRAYGHYSDRLRRTPTGWKLAHRYAKTEASPAPRP